MSKEQLEAYLMGTLKRLKKSEDEIFKTQGYTSEVEKLRILEELIKEQVKNENTHNPTCTAR